MSHTSDEDETIQAALEGGAPEGVLNPEALAAYRLVYEALGSPLPLPVGDGFAEEMAARLMPRPARRSPLRSLAAAGAFLVAPVIAILLNTGRYGALFRQLHDTAGLGAGDLAGLGGACLSLLALAALDRWVVGSVGETRDGRHRGI